MMPCQEMARRSVANGTCNKSAQKANILPAMSSSFGRNYARHIVMLINWERHPRRIVAAGAPVIAGDQPTFFIFWKRARHAPQTVSCARMDLMLQCEALALTHYRTPVIAESPCEVITLPRLLLQKSLARQPWSGLCRDRLRQKSPSAGWPVKPKGHVRNPNGRHLSKTSRDLALSRRSPVQAGQEAKQFYLVRQGCILVLDKAGAHSRAVFISGDILGIPEVLAGGNWALTAIASG